jgi:putative ATP-binding cassette transporter
MFNILKQIWRLTRIAVSGKGGRLSLALLTCIIGLELASIWISLRFIAWDADFFDALEQFDTARALYETGFYFALTAVSAMRFLISDYLRKFVIIQWRSRLTDHAVSKWLANQSYWHLREGLSEAPLENPDQRIAEDCRLFVTGLLREALDLFTRIVGIFSYVAVLWSLTNFALQFSLFGVDYSISHYLVWTAFIYVLIASIFTHMLGWPLKNLFFNQERREAEFRYSLVQLRDNAAEVAMSRGEEAEQRRFDQKFNAIVTNWRRLINREFIVGLFTRPYFQTVLRIPLFLSLPAYLAKEVTLGGLMQLSSAFSSVTTTLSWFIFSYKDLADFVATTQRLDGLLQGLDDSKRMSNVPTKIIRTTNGNDTLSVSNLSLFTPNNRELLKIEKLQIQHGERVLIQGPSGMGKTTLLRAICGLWPYGDGSIELPEQSIFFASQTPYLTSEGIAAALVYPAKLEGFEPAQLAHILETVGLNHRIKSMNDDGAGALEGMSNGEKQRFIIARILLAKPDWVFLDEPTTALDKNTEKEIFELLQEHLPDATIVCVAHRIPTGLNVTRRIKLKSSNVGIGTI